MPLAAYYTGTHHLKGGLAERAGDVEADGHVLDVRLLQGLTAGGAVRVLPEVLKRARLAEQVAAPRTEAGAVCLLRK